LPRIEPLNGLSRATPRRSDDTLDIRRNYKSAKVPSVASDTREADLT
jgi:hypothetical protein